MTANRSPVPVSTVVVGFVSMTGVASDTVTVGPSGGGEYPEVPVSPDGAPPESPVVGLPVPDPPVLGSE